MQQWIQKWEYRAIMQAYEKKNPTDEVTGVGGHTGREPVKRPFSVGCTTPVLDGLYVHKTTKDGIRALRINDIGGEIAIYLQCILCALCLSCKQ